MNVPLRPYLRPLYQLANRLKKLIQLRLCASRLRSRPLEHLLLLQQLRPDSGSTRATIALDSCLDLTQSIV